MKRLLLSFAVMLLVTLVQAEESMPITVWHNLAEAGITTAQYNLGVIYANGYAGVAKDAIRAVKWYRKAAEQGHAGAQNNLGAIYENGDGVIKDMVEAHAWFNVASALGNDLAKINLTTSEEQMTKDQIADATKLAREYFEKYGKKE